MRVLIGDLLEREHGCWKTVLLTGELRSAVRDHDPVLVIVDGSEFPNSCLDQIPDYPLDRIVVVGREPDVAAKAVALRRGAGGWVARDDVGERLGAEMRRILGCTHAPCPKPTG